MVYVPPGAVVFLFQFLLSASDVSYHSFRLDARPRGLLLADLSS